MRFIGIVTKESDNGLLKEGERICIGEGRINFGDNFTDLVTGQAAEEALKGMEYVVDLD